MAAVRALGRLRSAEAFDAIASFRDDDSEQVRIAVAQALGTTPGSVGLLRSSLAETATRAAPPRAPRPRTGSWLSALIGAIGDQGQSRHVGLLIGALDDRWPVGAAAARSRLAVHDIRGEPVG